MCKHFIALCWWYLFNCRWYFTFLFSCSIILFFIALEQLLFFAALLWKTLLWYSCGEGTGESFTKSKKKCFLWILKERWIFQYSQVWLLHCRKRKWNGGFVRNSLTHLPLMARCCWFSCPIVKKHMISKIVLLGQNIECPC